MNIFQKIDKMAAMRRLHKGYAETNYRNAMLDMEDKLRAHLEAETIAEMWRQSKPGRTAGTDSTFPIYATLTLAKDDDLCVEGMLFLEQVEEQFQVEADGTPTSYALAAYIINPKLTIVFDAHLEGMCKIVTTHKLKESVPHYETERTVVCHE